MREAMEGVARWFGIRYMGVRRSRYNGNKIRRMRTGSKLCQGSGVSWI